MSVKKSSIKSQKEPSEEDLNACEYNMTMAQLKDPTGTFSKMPKSVIVNGKRIPRTALRKRDLCRFHLLLGGKIPSKTRRVIKNYSVPKKPSIEQARYEKLVDQRSLDHKPKKSLEENKKRHASLSPSKHSSSLLRQMNKLKLTDALYASKLKKPVSKKPPVDNNSDWDSTTDEADY